MLKGKKTLISLYLVLLILFGLEIHNYIKLREVTLSKNYSSQLNTLKEEYSLIKNFNTDNINDAEILNVIERCIEEETIPKITNFFKENEIINYRNIRTISQVNTGCFHWISDDYYINYNLQDIYDNNLQINSSFIKEKNFYNDNIDEIITTKLDDLIIEISNFRKSIELMKEG